MANYQIEFEWVEPLNVRGIHPQATRFCARYANGEWVYLRKDFGEHDWYKVEETPHLAEKVAQKFIEAQSRTPLPESLRGVKRSVDKEGCFTREFLDNHPGVLGMGIEEDQRVLWELRRRSAVPVFTNMSWAGDVRRRSRVE